MRYTYDFEFRELPNTIDAISLGIVAEDGREYYAVNADMNVADVLAHDFLRREVWPHLPTSGDPLYDPETGDLLGGSELDHSDPSVKPPPTIADEVRDFLLTPGTPVELWANYAAFDHVSLAWLWGPMVDLPAGIPMFTRDIKDWRVRLGEPPMPQQLSGSHDALADARQNWAMIRELESVEARRLNVALTNDAHLALAAALDADGVSATDVVNRALALYGYAAQEVFGRGHQLASFDPVTGRGSLIEVRVADGATAPGAAVAGGGR